ncbi:MAG TPA: TetR/AcrR family transcriptional regulator [Anaerolineales bacterium]|nr:TetR/AcrR family transcriptional regulator [Anaerolineales bacterium]
MKKEKSTKGEATRLAVEDAAIALFMEQGYHATSMRQIAERADLALGGIYNHFASKEEIFAAIIIDKHPYKKVLPVVLAAKGDTAEEFFKNAARFVIEELSGNPEYMQLLLIEIVEFKGVHGKLMLREVAPKILPIFEKVVRSRKELRTTNPALVMRSFFGMIISYFITDMVVSNSVLSQLMPKNTVDVYVDLFLHGVLKEPV